MFPCSSLHLSHLSFLPHPVSLSLFSVSASPLLLCKQVHQYRLSRFHVYALLYDVCFSLSDRLHSIIGSRFIHLIRTNSNVFFFIAEQYSVVMYVPHLLCPSLCQWTFRLLPYPGYYKQCCSKLWGACIFWNYDFIWIYAQEWDCWIIWQLYFQFLKEHPNCFSQWLYQFIETFPLTVQEGSFFSALSTTFIAYRFF